MWNSSPPEGEWLSEGNGVSFRWFPAGVEWFQDGAKLMLRFRDLRPINVAQVTAWLCQAIQSLNGDDLEAYEEEGFLYLGLGID